MDKKDMEMIAWWQKNDRVTLCIAASNPERLEWAKANQKLPWQFCLKESWVMPGGIMGGVPDWSGGCTYRINPTYQIPAEPVSPWDEVEVAIGSTGGYVCRWKKFEVQLSEVINAPGFGGILWRDDESGTEGWSWTPLGFDKYGCLAGHQEHWLRPCKPVRVRFWRGA